MKKIISLFLVFAIVFSFAVPAFAENSSVVTLWDKIMMKIAAWSDDMGDLASSSNVPMLGSVIQGGFQIVGKICASLDDSICAISDDHLHHGLPIDPIVCDEQHGRKVVSCHCDYCGEHFWAYSEDIGEYYDEFIGRVLPAQTVNSDGSFIVTAEHNYFEYVYWSPRRWYYCSHYGSYGKDTFSDSSTYVSGTVNHNADGSLHLFVVPSSGSYFYFYDGDYFRNYYRLVAPVSGFYSFVDSPALSCNNDVHSYSRDYAADTPVHYSAGSTLTHEFSIVYSRIFESGSGNKLTYLSANFFPPQYKVTPDTALDITSGDTYNIDNRIGQYIQDFTYNGQTYNHQIVNETTNQYYSPTNNEYFDMNGWSYDYSTQTYNITNNNGDTVTVTYGDEYITINEGDTIYNYYYYITNEAPDDPDDPGTSGLIEWLESFKTWLGEKLDGLGFNVNVTEIVEDMDAPGSDESDDDDASGLLDLVKTIFGGVLKIALKTTDLIIGGVDALSSGIDNFGSFFRLYNPNNPNGVYAYAVPTPSPGGA